MTLSFTGRKRIRKNFGRIQTGTTMPNLIEVQKSSYDHFLQMGVPADDRENVGLQEVFTTVFPIEDFALIRNFIKLEIAKNSSRI